MRAGKHTPTQTHAHILRQTNKPSHPHSSLLTLSIYDQQGRHSSFWVSLSFVWISWERPEALLSLRLHGTRQPAAGLLLHKDTHTHADVTEVKYVHAHTQTVKPPNLFLTLVRADEHTSVTTFTQMPIEHTHVPTLSLTYTDQSSGLIQAWWRPIAFHGSWLPDILSSGSVFSAAWLVHSRKGRGWMERRTERERWRNG